MSANIANQTGPNGHPVGYDDNGDFVEWIPDEEAEQNDGKPVPLVLRRGDDSIKKAYDRLWAKVWWNRHMASGEAAAGRDAARVIEEKYGLDFLEPGDDVEWGVCTGKMMALAWILGAEWEEAGDT
jgi:hypothetical protein